jgi:predicted MFS family arabinose efflux permease
LQETRGTSAFRYLLGTLALPSLNTKVGALALCRASHFVFAYAMLVCGLTSDITMMAAGRFVAGVAAGFGVFSIFLIVFDATEPEKRSAALWRSPALRSEQPVGRS